MFEAVRFRTSLLAQNVVNEQTANDLDLRTLAHSQADWTASALNPMDGIACGDYGGTGDCDPNRTGEHPDPVRNVGWYFDLSDSGERVVSDVIAREGNLIVLSYAPGGSMCATGGYTWVMAMDACSGGRLSEANFDVTGDGGIDDQFFRFAPDATYHTPVSQYASRSQFRKGVRVGFISTADKTIESPWYIKKFR
jgi:Tfp pilus tip-associated adhesin PilY1